MRDLIHMLLCMIAGMVNAAVTASIAGIPAMLVVIFAAGWAMAQHDHNYKRVRGG